MSKMTIIDENGFFKVDPGTLKTIESNHPAYKARIALALPRGDWLYAPTKGHDLKPYQNAKASKPKIEEFQKSVKLYLAPYGPDVVSRFTARGSLSLQVLITKETINV